MKQIAEHALSRPDSESYWGHAMSWWNQRQNPDVLLLAYEHMKIDLRGTVESVAEFMGVNDEARIALAARQASFEFMKAHAEKYDDNLVHRVLDPVCGLPPNASSTKVTEGQAGRGRREVTADIRAKLDARWAETMGKEFGLETYGALLDQLRA